MIKMKIIFSELEIYKVVKDKTNDRWDYFVQLNGKIVFLELHYRSKGPFKGNVWWNRLMTNYHMRDLLHSQMGIRVNIDLIEQVKFENCPKGIREAIKQEFKEEYER